MKFNLNFCNHPTSAWVVGDIVRPIIYGLQDLGHQASASTTVIDPSAVQVFLEYFTDGLAWPVITTLKRHGIPMGLILTEDALELQRPENAKRWASLLVVIPHLDFFWCLANPEDYADFIPPERIARLELGAYQSKLGRPYIQRAERPIIDFLIYGKRTERREYFKRLIEEAGKVAAYSVVETEGGDIPQPDFVVDSIVSQSSVILDIARDDHVTLPSSSRLAFALQHSIPIVSDAVFEMRHTFFLRYVHQVAMSAVAQNPAPLLTQEFAAKCALDSKIWRSVATPRRFLSQPIEVCTKFSRISSPNLDILG
jgi:hypothetical protein